MAHLPSVEDSQPHSVSHKHKYSFKTDAEDFKGSPHDCSNSSSYFFEVKTNVKAQVCNFYSVLLQSRFAMCSFVLQ